MKQICSVLFSILLMGATAYGQAPPQAQPQAPAVKVTDADVKAFKAVQPEIAKLETELRGKIAKADTSEAQQIQVQYQQKMIEAVKDKGLTVDKYNAISQGGGAQ